ncbi:hypothetical protein K3495_g6809 [Podosphaera aphanis]|nr:hypothetical protein K3495_g6809 [Podosphaera aphanis]
MRPLCSLIRRSRPYYHIFIPRQRLLTLAIETSCDDTSVAVLEKHADNSATLHFHSKVTSDNRSFKGVHPIAAHESHQKNLASLTREALQKLPTSDKSDNDSTDVIVVGKNRVKKLDFITVTRGPGMRASLITGIDMAKGLAVAWQIPLLGVNHMQAHALTPRLVSALNAFAFKKDVQLHTPYEPQFPFLSLLVSGGHTMLVHSRSLAAHQIIANTTDISLGDMLDKAARVILPPSHISSSRDVMYGRLLEKFAFPLGSVEHNYTPPKASMKPRDGSRHGYSWTITPPYISPGPEGPLTYADAFSFSGIGSKARSTVKKHPEMSNHERRCLAQTVMTVAFEHLASRVIYAFAQKNLGNVSALVVSGGVASNKFLQTVLRKAFDARGLQHVRLIVPPSSLCTDNAAMIAWTGIEMFEAGWTTDLCATALRQWSIDPKSDDGGILGVEGWNSTTNLNV